MSSEFSPPSFSPPPVSPTAPPRYAGAGPDGVLRTHVIADDVLGPRLCRGALLTPGWLLRQSLPLVVGAFLAAIVASSTDSWPPAVVTVVVVLGLVLLAQATMLTLGIVLGQRRMRRIMPAGTPVGAEFTPLWIGHRVGATYSQIPLERFDRVVVNSRVVLLCTGRRTVVLLPRELVPPQVIADYRARYGRRGLRRR
ncbi:hypothetical protein [Gordonia polyisoprenivorans]|uniref:hypothetical protein n=1 Tax=Gordonia polyisoprenivorans TaxID=84595 RepID=UPI001F0A0FCD|nr:hypothetical protein [Gordonia polyisoprenivorans]UZF57426.1 hypothetical protein LH935_05365 [Gordonia polyisoprenivorans]